MVAHPLGYSWWSYAINGNGNVSDLIAPHASYISLGSNKSKRLDAYRLFLSQGLEECVVKKFEPRQMATLCWEMIALRLR